jgi:hypothetical protein
MAGAVKMEEGETCLVKQSSSNLRSRVGKHVQELSEYMNLFNFHLHHIL